MISLSLLKAFYAGSGCGYSFLKPKSPQEDFRGKQGRPKCLFLSAAASTQGTSFKPGGEVNWEEPWQCGFAGKSWGLSSRGGGSKIWGRLESSPGFVISFDFQQKNREEALGGEEG